MFIIYKRKKKNQISRWIIMYFLMPETEDRTLEDIEVHFSDNQRKITDRRIQKNVSVKSFNIPSGLVSNIANEMDGKNIVKSDKGHVNKAFTSDNAWKCPSLV